MTAVVVPEHQYFQQQEQQEQQQQIVAENTLNAEASGSVDELRRALITDFARLARQYELLPHEVSGCSAILFACYVVYMNHNSATHITQTYIFGAADTGDCHRRADSMERTEWSAECTTQARTREAEGEVHRTIAGNSFADRGD